MRFLHQIQGWKHVPKVFSVLFYDVSLEQLSRAMRLGDLGEQVVLKSPKAFEQITFVGSSMVSSTEYYPRRLRRDEKARALYREEATAQGIEGIFMRDLLKEGAQHVCL